MSVKSHSETATGSSYGYPSASPPLESVPLALAVTDGSSAVIRDANALFASFLGYAPHELQGLPLSNLCREPSRIQALLDRARERAQTEVALELTYATPEGERMANTLAQPLPSSVDGSMLVQVIDPKAWLSGHDGLYADAVELRLANERLLLSSLRERELAERADAATREVQRLLQRKAVLAEVNALLSASLDLTETLDVVTRLALPHLADFCLIRLCHDGEPPRLALAHRALALEEQLRTQLDSLERDEVVLTLHRQLVESTEPWLSTSVPPAASDSHVVPSVLAESGATHALVVTLLARGTTLGTMMLFSCAAERAFQAPDVEFALELAARASIAIDNALLYREAQQAIRLREDVLAIVSHDLRNPLGAISMTAQSLLRSVNDDQSRLKRSYEIILRSSRHMRRLIEELLEVASLRTGQLVLKCEPVELGSLVREALDMIEPAAQQKGIRMVQRPIPASPLACDGERIMRVLTNLLSNAVKFTPDEGMVEVFVEATGHELQVHVRDTGPGVVESEQERLFEQYWKGTRTGRTGMGLGLYIARGIVEAHGGRIWVESQPPHGSTFVFALPRPS